LSLPESDEGLLKIELVESEILSELSEKEQPLMFIAAIKKAQKRLNGFE
jgi:hypothetical protein